MTALLSPSALAFIGGAFVLCLWGSPNPALWAATILTIPIVVWLAGGRNANRALLWVIALNWLTVFGDVMSAELAGEVIKDRWLGPYQVEAILFTLCALLALAAGMRIGMNLVEQVIRPIFVSDRGVSVEKERNFSLHRIIALYFMSLGLVQFAGGVAHFIPSVAQPFLAVGLIKFVCIYLLAARVFESQRGYGWLILVLLLEMITGLVGFFSAYKEAFFVMFIALASSYRPITPRMWIFAAAAVLVVAWASLGWTSVKKEYRSRIYMYPIEYRLEWMKQRLLVDGINYQLALQQLFERIGYTHFYSVVLARQDNGSIPTGLDYYAAAVRHIVTPRMFFPDKASLNDSKLTRQLIGLEIDKNTSIGVGYVAEAQVDFGFPGLLIPILMLGLLTGAAAKYFMTRTAPILVREAFATATCFLAFPMAQNIDKNLGGFLTAWIVMALMLRYGYPMVARWLTFSNQSTVVSKTFA